MKRWLIPCLILWLAGVSPALATDTGSRTVITFGGAITKANRPAVGPQDTGLFRVMGVAFDKGYAFDNAALAGLPQMMIMAKRPDQPEATGAFSGPRLADLAGLAGAKGKLLTAWALDGYQAEITPELIAEYGPILATHLDGVALGMGGLGPAMIVFPDNENAELEEQLGALEVWALIYIGVQ